MGVEPTFSAWKADVLAIILMVHLCAAQPARAGYVPGVPRLNAPSGGPLHNINVGDLSAPSVCCIMHATAQSLSALRPAALAQSTRLELALRC